MNIMRFIGIAVLILTINPSSQAADPYISSDAGTLQAGS